MVNNPINVQMTNNQNYVTNFYPIKFHFEDYDVVRVEANEKSLQNLRNTYNTTHSFFQHGDYIYISNMTGEDLGIGKTTKLSVLGDFEVTASLVKHIFFKTFLENYPGYKLNGFYPFILQSAKAENDLIRKYLPKGLQGRLSYLKQIEVQLRKCILNNEERIGFVVNSYRQWKLDVSCKELQEKKFDIKNREVIHSVSIPGLENILLPDETLVGYVKDVKGDFAIIVTNEGEQEYKLEELYLRKTMKNIEDFLGFALRSPNKATQILSRLKIDKQSSISPKSILKSINSACKVLFYDKNGNSLFYENKDGFCFSLDDKNERIYKTYELEPPLFVFDPSRLRTNSGADFGLVNYGPYDSGQFTPKEPTILVICHQRTRGRATQFLKELIDGMPNSKYFKKGLKSKYELHRIKLDIKEINSYSISEIEQITRKIKYTPDIVIIEIPVSFKNERIVSRSLYFQSKAHFLNLQIPIQIITSEIINKYDEYKLNAIALQMYAKLGGLPWTIQTKESVDKEIIIGIGNSIFRNNAYQGNKQNRIVGISTFFSADGQYMMSGNIKDVPYDSYFQELLDSLKESISVLSKEYAWQKNQTVRFIFHIFKPIKNIEFEVVKELVKECSNYKIQFAFVTISERHPFIMFDNNQKGVTKWGKTIGEFIPFRGANIVINDSTCLVQMLGVKEMKTGKQGASNPIQIRILKPTSYGVEDDILPYLFHDLHYITQHIFKFTYLSWRGFMPNQKPATMLYSGLISRLLGKLRMIPGWKSEVINFNLKRKKWFL
jgi:hypothetical protein